RAPRPSLHSFPTRRSSDLRVLDHFVAVPGLGLKGGAISEMESVDVAFTPESSQVFRIGAASCAVPGATAGLGVAHRRFATLPWRSEEHTSELQSRGHLVCR